MVMSKMEGIETLHPQLEETVDNLDLILCELEIKLCYAKLLEFWNFIISVKPSLSWWVHSLSCIPLNTYTIIIKAHGQFFLYVS